MEARKRDFLKMTEQVKLTKELVSLVHYVELNESGWVQKTLLKIILAVLRARKVGAVTKQELREEVKNATTHDFGGAAIEKAISQLLSDKKLLENPKKHYQLRQEAIREIDEAMASTTAEETAARVRFEGLIKEAAPEVEATALWSRFENDYLYPLISKSGANTLNLISGGATEIPTEGLGPVMETVPAEVREQVTHAVIKFLDPNNQQTRQFILKRVAATFFVGAVSLDNSTIDALDRKRTRKSSIKLFLDTNTLFSVLSLHENDEDDSVQSLMALNRNPNSPIQLKLFVFPETIDEATRVLHAAMNHLGANPMPSNVARVGMTSNLSGVYGRYFQAAAKSTIGLSPREYFEPYISGLAGILKGRNIEIIDRSLLVSTLDPEFLEDVQTMEEHEAKKPEERRKNHEAIKHDVYIWHCVERARPAGLASPLDASDWFVTLDKRLMGFDAFKRGGRRNYVPVCIDPSSFIQYAQFWTPRSADFEKALFGSLRLPLLFRDFDTDTEDVTVAILRRMATFEEVHTFSSAELQTILLDNAVRSRFRRAHSSEEEVQIIRDELLAVHEGTVQRVKQLEAEAHHKDALVGKQAQEAESLRAQRDTFEAQQKKTSEERDLAQGRAKEADEKVAALERQLAAAAAEKSETDKELVAFQMKERKAVERQQMTRSALRFVFLVGVLPGLLAALAVGGLLMYLLRVQHPVLPAAVIGCLVGFGLIWHFGKTHAALAPFPRLRKCITVLGVVSFGALFFAKETGSALYQNYVQSNQEKLPGAITSALGGEKKDSVAKE
ncbi:conserved membrane hypothetical protein [Cupriavidus taiwanensis]|uniref:hypothetical protein n=1 Tax=Cupriavidus taiwanensis TaxID=164546 RepID=UPI000E15A0AE|nr:hypothetical protein [Cupriavidus taiwanensis]SOY93394.1 conserved membrane hypothetical protein [Cupriavidus taiwanensis]SOY96358.1 conserved membrane hypothetical protein [Cupriavidus taiwanensis]